MRERGAAFAYAASPRCFALASSTASMPTSILTFSDTSTPFGTGS